MKEEKILKKINRLKNFGALDWSVYDPDKETVNSIESLVKQGYKFEKTKIGKIDCYVITF